MLFDLDGPLPRWKRVSVRGLLLSCRLIYGEASALLYSSNRFVIHYRHARGDGNDGAEPSLQPLRNLTASSLASLANLKIVLSQASCHYQSEEEAGGKCCDDIRDNMGSHGARYCQQHHTNDHDRPLRSSDSIAGPMLDEWLQTANYLSSGIIPGTLRLSLVCDVDEEEAGMDAATRAVAPLSLLPELRDCDLRLCKSPSPELTRIARNAALQACRRPEPPPSSSSLRLLSLPRELRLRILEYTDLVTPWREVTWTRLERGYQYPAEGCYPRGNVPCPPANPWHHGCQFRGCYHQTRIFIKGGTYYGSIGCFCRLRHAAFSSASACICWAPPIPLFLICRALSEDAKFVFFSLNRFVVSDTLASFHPCKAFNLFATIPWPEDYFRFIRTAEYLEAQPPRAYPAERFAASHFLREVVPADCLGYLRFLELIFPPYNYMCWPDDGHPAMQEWIETIDWANNKIRSRGLTLRLTMSGLLRMGPDHPDGRQEVSEAQGIQVLAGYDRILKPLARLGGDDGFAQFYADFAWPWKWTKWAREKYRAMGPWREPDGGEAWLKSKEDALNERAERFILGDRYERLSATKTKKEERAWTREHRIYS
jgi:hypothetical protein